MQACPSTEQRQVSVPDASDQQVPEGRHDRRNGGGRRQLSHQTLQSAGVAGTPANGPANSGTPVQPGFGTGRTAGTSHQRQPHQALEPPVHSRYSRFGTGSPDENRIALRSDPGGP